VLGSFLGIAVVTSAAACTVPADLTAFAASPERPEGAIARGVGIRGRFLCGVLTCARERQDATPEGEERSEGSGRAGSR
jgi:hypothetical protein